VYDGAPNGIPFVVVSADQPSSRSSSTTPTKATQAPTHSARRPIEGGTDSTGDRHVLMVDLQNKRLYELFAAYPLAGGGWIAGSGAIFDLTSNALRPAGWTSADAAGLPIFPTRALRRSC